MLDDMQRLGFLRWSHRALTPPRLRIAGKAHRCASCGGEIGYREEYADYASRGRRCMTCHGRSADAPALVDTVERGVVAPPPPSREEELERVLRSIMRVARTGWTCPDADTMRQLLQDIGDTAFEALNDGGSRR